MGKTKYALEIDISGDSGIDPSKQKCAWFAKAWQEIMD